MTAIVQRLRRGEDGLGHASQLDLEAADEIERLRAENEALRRIEESARQYLHERTTETRRMLADALKSKT